MTAHPELQPSKRGVLLSVHVQPGAGTTAIVGRHGQALKIRVAAPPTGGKANRAVVELIAASFGLSAAQVEITSGHASRSKRVVLGDLTAAEAEAAVDRLLATCDDSRRR